MANRFWVGGGSSSNWNATGNTNWGTVSNTQDNAAVPTAADDVFFDGVGTGAADCVLSTTAPCRSLNCTGYANTLTISGQALNIGDATAGAGSIALKFAAGMTLTKDSSASINLISTSGTEQTIDTGGKNCPSFAVTGTGSNYKPVATINITGGAWTYSASGATWTINGQTIDMALSNASNRTFAGGGKTYALLTSAITNAVLTISGANTFSDITTTSNTSKVVAVVLAADQIVTGTLSITGNSVVARTHIRSSVSGTARTITAATVTLSNVDLQDITGAGAGSWNLAAITGNSGDCGGNSGITFTTPAAQASTGTASFTWSTHGWTSRVPLPQDDVTIANAFVASQTITADMPRMGKNITFVGATGTPTWSPNTDVSVYGSWTLIAGMAIGAVTQNLTFAGRGSSTITNAGLSYGTITPVVDCGAGTYTLNDAILTGNKSINFTSGTFTANGFNVTAASAGITNVATVVINMGSGTWTFTGSGNAWNMNGSANPTINADTSTLVFSSTSAPVFLGGAGRSYNKVKFTGAGVGIATISTNSITINELEVTAPRPFRLSAGITLTVGRFVPLSSAGNIITMDTTGAAATITSSFYMHQLDYLSLTNITAAGTSKWYAGIHSTNVSGNTGWQLNAGTTAFNDAGKMSLVA